MFLWTESGTPERKNENSFDELWFLLLPLPLLPFHLLPSFFLIVMLGIIIGALSFFVFFDVFKISHLSAAFLFIYYLLTLLFLNDSHENFFLIAGVISSSNFYLSFILFYFLGVKKISEKKIPYERMTVHIMKTNKKFINFFSRWQLSNSQYFLFWEVGGGWRRRRKKNFTLVLEIF